MAVVGAGLAGSLVADAMIRTGASVIVLESGPRRMDYAAGQGPRAGRWPGRVMWKATSGGKRRPVAAVVGHGPGGSSALYGAALERFREADFDGSRAVPDHALETIWPVDSDEMAAWYERAEEALGVSGQREEAGFRGTLPALSARDHALIETLRANGRSPYRLPVAISYKPGCAECQGNRCERRCKGEGWTSVLSNHPETDRFRLCFDAHVSSVSSDDAGTVLLEVTGQGQVRAKRLVLAAGALNTPRLLEASPALFSGPMHPMVGRGLMFHSTDLFIVRAPDGLAVDGPKKVLGLRDFYDLPGGRGGEIQSLGFDLSSRLVSRHLGEVLSAKGMPGGQKLMTLTRLPAAALAARLGPQPVFATVLEDLPYKDNRVVLGREGHGPEAPILIDYKVSEELSERWYQLRDAVTGAFAPLPVSFLLRRVAPNLGHPCGTVRMGDDPAIAPVDASGRLRGARAPVFVADASVFPSSGGTNPALTIAANAMRIAAGLTGELNAGAIE